MNDKKKPKKPHVIVPKEDDVSRAQKLNRNFNDVFAYINNMEKRIESLEARG